MTAIGLLIFVIGLLLSSTLDNSDASNVTAGLFLIVGFGLTTGGIVLWLWRVMP